MPTRDIDRMNRFLPALRDPRTLTAVAGTVLALGLVGCESMDGASGERYRPYRGTEGQPAAEPEVNTGLASLSARTPPPTLIEGEAPPEADERHAAAVAESARLLDEYFAKAGEPSLASTTVAASAEPARSAPGGYDPSAEVGPTGSSRYAPQRDEPVEVAAAQRDPVVDALMNEAGAPSRGPGQPSPNAGLSRFNDDTTPATRTASAQPTQNPAGSPAIRIEDVPAGSAPTPVVAQRETAMTPIRVVDEGGSQADPALSVVTTQNPPRQAPPQGTLQGRPVEASAAVASADGSMARVPARSPEDRKNELVDELVAVLGEIAHASDEPYRMGLALAGLETLSPGALYELTESGVLMPDEVRTLLAAHELLSGLSAGGGVPDPGHVSDLLGDVKEKLDAHAPLKIPAAELCTRVLGYGQYDMFPKAPDGSYQFVAGRRQPVIVYVEVDRFGRRPDVGDDGLARWEVELSQTLEIYHDADDLLVMARPAETDTSLSRNKIRDYYLINQTYLPENLSVGRYNLKVIMRDENKQAVAEAIVPISIVPSTTGFGGG